MQLFLGRGLGKKCAPPGLAIPRLIREKLSGKDLPHNRLVLVGTTELSHGTVNGLRSAKEHLAYDHHSFMRNTALPPISSV